MTNSAAIGGMVTAVFLGLFFSLFFYFDVFPGSHSRANSSIAKFPYYYWIVGGIFIAGQLTVQGVQFSPDEATQVRASGFSFVFLALILYFTVTVYVQDERFVEDLVSDWAQLMLYLSWACCIVLIICNALVYLGIDLSPSGAYCHSEDPDIRATTVTVATPAAQSSATPKQCYTMCVDPSQQTQPTVTTVQTSAAA